MISFDEAYHIVLSKSKDFGRERAMLGNAIGRVLRECWHADRDFPPYHRVTMDGIAVNYDTSPADKIFLIESIAAAGDPQKKLIDNRACLEVMTGSVLPLGTDTVIRYEDMDIIDGYAHVNTSFSKGQNIHRKGEDRSDEDLLLTPGNVLSAAEIGVGATIGKSKVFVARHPKTVIISTGDELVNIEDSPLPHQIRKSNVYRMTASLNAIGIDVETSHLDDDYEEILEELVTYIRFYDLVVLSGGVSKGKFDFLPKALKELGVEKHFHRVAQRPGKPFWFGTYPDGATVFAMPGNPISSFMCTQVYLLPWIEKCLETNERTTEMAILDANVSFNPDLTYFLEVKISCNEKGHLIASPKKGHGSGDLANLMHADAFIQLPSGKEVFKKGEAYPIIRYR